MRLSRRSFLKAAAFSGASFAASTGIKRVDNLIPYVVPPEALPAVDWHTLATTCRECPAGCGMHISHRDGRITKAEGNPDHPVNRGGLCARGQSSLQGVYDPDRVRGVLYRSRGAGFQSDNWRNALSAIGSRLREVNGTIAIISRLETGTLAEIFSSFLSAFGSDRLLFYEAFHYGPLRRAHGELFGRRVIPYYDLEKAEYILSFGADFLESWISNVQYARQFADMHQMTGGRIGRFDYIGPRLSMTAANADKYIQLSPGTEKDAALTVLKIMADERLLKAGRDLILPIVRHVEPRAVVGHGFTEDDLRKIARRFANSRSVSLAGPAGASGPEAEKLAYLSALLNLAAGSIGTLVDFSRPHALSNTGTEEQALSFLQGLTPDDILIVHKTNPAYSRPAYLKFLSKAGLIIYLGTMLDETAAIADWFLPVNDDLESWGDYEPWAGTFGLLQPTMRPLSESVEAGDVLIRLAADTEKVLKKRRDGTAVKTTADWVKQFWRAQHREAGWEDSLRKGGNWGPSVSAGRERLTPKTSAINLAEMAPGPPMKKEEALLWLWPSIMLFDGRTANRGWIQEAPEPVSTIMWGSWIDIHPVKAKLLGIHDDDIIEIVTADNRQIKAPARVTAEIAEEAVALAFGQGHTALGSIALNVGANAFNLLPPGTEFDGYFGRVTIRKTGGKETPAFGMTTKEQHDRDLLKWVYLEKAREMKPGPLVLPLPEGYTKERDLYPPHRHYRHRWAMAIDLQRCIGCGACGVACYAENNLLVVGREGLGGQRGFLRSAGELGIRGTKEGRIMAWLRIVPYRHEKDSLRIGFLPMLCQHCDSAPCEPVCPVFASVNNEEGLNAQIYNRCIGTRYCSNNCPYKVRRFNWLNTHWKPPLNWQLNPEVTVRVRGVMEKCTFCVQRIRNAQYRARRENRKLKDGEIQPACVQSCPAKVFTFGDLLDPESKVSKITRQDARRYHVLEELNTKPAVTYLYRILQK